MTHRTRGLALVVPMPAIREGGVGRSRLPHRRHTTGDFGRAHLAGTVPPGQWARRWRHHRYHPTGGPQPSPRTPNTPTPPTSPTPPTCVALRSSSSSFSLSLSLSLCHSFFHTLSLSWGLGVWWWLGVCCNRFCNLLRIVLFPFSARETRLRLPTCARRSISARRSG